MDPKLGQVVEQSPNGETPPEATPAPPVTPPAAPTKPDAPFTPEQQKIINRLIKSESDAAVLRAQADFEANQAEVRTAQMRDGLREQQQYKDLADNLQRELDEIKPRYERATAELTDWNKIADDEYRAALQELPVFLHSFAPKADASGIEKRRWVTQARQAARDAGVPPQGGGGNGPSPNPLNQQGGPQGVTVEEEKNVKLQDPRYKRF